MIKIIDEGGFNIPYKQSIFPGGEVFIKLEPENRLFELVYITANLESAKDIIELLLITNALRVINPRVIIDLQMPYVPYARQDRVMTFGESLSIKVFADIINSQKYDQVEIWDPHSDVTSALINNVVVVEQHEIAKSIERDWASTVLVAPDAGAAKKIYKLAKEVNCPVIIANKIRDVATSKITHTLIDIKGYETAKFLIVDDICDGGRTFTELSKIMRRQGADYIDLYVTHGIFAAGLNVFDGLIETIYCANSWIESKRIIKV